MPRVIKEGDIVLVFVVNEETELWTAVHCGRGSKYRKRRFEVMSTPADTGDLWYLRDTQGTTELAINPSSANLDGLVKVGNVNEQAPNYAGCRITHVVSYDKGGDRAVLRCQGLDGEWGVLVSSLDEYTRQWLDERRTGACETPGYIAHHIVASLSSPITVDLASELRQLIEQAVLRERARKEG